MKNTERKLYIDGLKGIACLLIMLGHFCGIYKYAQDATAIRCTIIDVLTTSFLEIFTSEGFWLYLFFVVSGFLLSYTSVNSLTDIFKKFFLRFMRFAIPILGSGIIIYLIQSLIGFHNLDLQRYITNSWFARAYASRLSFYDVIVAPFTVLIKGKVIINSPYWVLRHMLLSSLLIYINSYINHKLQDRFKYIGEMTSLVFLIVPLLLRQSVISSCMLGMVVSREVIWIEKIYKQHRLLPFIAMFLPIVSWLSGRNIFYPIGFAAMLVAIPEVAFVKKFCEAKPILWLSKISFGIYSFHWPVICSIGAWTMLKLIGCVSNNFLAIISFGTCVGITLLISMLFHISVEKYTGKICNRIKQVFK